MSRKVGDQVGDDSFFRHLSDGTLSRAELYEFGTRVYSLFRERRRGRERERVERMIHPDRCAKGEEQFIGSLKSRGARDRDRIVVA